MKKIILGFVMMAVMFSFFTTQNVVDAAEQKGIVYYNIKIDNKTTLAPGEYYLSTNSTLEDANYMSAKFPSTISARVKVTTGLSKANRYVDYTKYTDGGYDLDVIVRDALFDGCPQGTLVLHPALVDGKQSWGYYCNYGGIRDVGPYYIYEVKTTTYTVNDVKLELAKNFVKPSGPTQIKPSDLVATITVTVDGVKKTLTTTDFTIDSKNDTVNPLTGDESVTVLFEGEKVGQNLAIQYNINGQKPTFAVSVKNNQFVITSNFENVPGIKYEYSYDKKTWNNASGLKVDYSKNTVYFRAIDASQNVIATVDYKVAKKTKSPKTGYVSPMAGMLGVAGFALLSCGLLELKKKYTK